MLYQRYYRNAIASGKGNPVPVQDFVTIYILTDTHLRYGVDGNPLAPGAGTAAGRAYYASQSKVRNFIDIVKFDNPDYVTHLGDVCDGVGDYVFFQNQWAQLDIPKSITIGNHDLDHTYDELIDLFGYTGREEVAGSVFNESVRIEKGSMKVRYIILDTNFDSSNIHINTTQGRLNDQGLLYLQTELQSCTEQFCVIASHMLPHYIAYNSYFNSDSAAAIKVVVDNALLVNPNLKKVIWLAGHAHTPSIVTYNNLGAGLLGYRLPDSIEGRGSPEVSISCIVLKIFEDNSYNFATYPLQYPYPV